MATTIKPADLTVTIAESVLLNGFEQGTTNTYTISDVNEVQRRIINCNGSLETTLIKFGPYGAGASRGPEIHVDDVRYLRITNLDDTNYATLRFQGSASTDYSFRLDPTGSHLLMTTQDSGSDDAGVTNYSDISGINLEDLKSIRAIANSASVDLELFVASI